MSPTHHLSEDQTNAQPSGPIGDGVCQLVRVGLAERASCRETPIISDLAVHSEQRDGQQFLSKGTAFNRGYRRTSRKCAPGTSVVLSELIRERIYYIQLELVPS